MNNTFFQKQCLCLAATLAIALANCSLAYAACAPDLDKNIQKILDDAQHNEKLPIFGLQLSVLCKNDTVPHDFVMGAATLHDNVSTPVTPDTLFQIGSLTKSFTAALILKLEADGILSINDEIGKWLPQIPDTWKKITIQQLLNHTSGIDEYVNTFEFMSSVLGNKTQKEWEQKEILHFIDKKPLMFSPGKDYFYSNTNYVVAGMIIETVMASRDKSYAEATQKQIIEPLLLTHTYYLPHAYSEEILGRMAHSYDRTGRLPLADLTGYNMSVANTAGANVSTAHDVTRWFQNLMHGNVLPAAQLAEMKTMVDEETGQPTSNLGYGLGIYQRHFQNEIVWMHLGQGFASTARMYWLSCRDVVVAITTNYNLTPDNMNPDHINDPDGAEVVIEQVIASIQNTDPANECKVIAPVHALTPAKSRHDLRANPDGNLMKLLSL